MTNVENKLLFIINPISGGVDKSDFKAQLQSICLEKSIEFAIFETTGKDDKVLIQKQVEFHHPDIVVACGGDGTVNLVGQALLGRAVPMGIIPLGSANGMATEFLISKGLDENIKVLLEGKKVEMDVLEVNDEHLCLHLSDIGFNAKLIQEFEEADGRGQLMYFRGFFKTIWQKEGISTLIKTPDRMLKQKTEMITFANATKYGTGARINPNGKIDDGHFETCIFKPYPRWQLLHLTWLFFTGRLKRSKYVRILSTDQVEVSLAHPQPLQVDGEVLGEVATVRVKVRPEKIPVLVPQEYGKL